MNLPKFVKKSKSETESLSSSISNRYKGKYERYNITVFSLQRKNKRFRKSKRRRHNNERKTIYRENERRMIEEVKKQQAQDRMLLI